MNQIPANTVDLLALLEEEYPARCIRPDETLAQANRYAGARELIDNISVRLKQQIEQEMESKDVHS